MSFERINENISDQKKENTAKSLFPKLSLAISSMFISTSLFFSSPKTANADYLSSSVCPKGSRAYAFSLEPGQVCRGEKYKNLCWECRIPNGRVVSTSIEIMQKKVETGISSTNPKIGKKYTLNDAKKIREKIGRWDKNKLETVIKKLNGNLTEEERTIFRGALENWPDIKYNSMRLGIDPRIAYLVAVAESRLIQKVGSSGEVSPMQIMPESMVLMHNAYGKNDDYIKGLIKKGINWRKDKVAQIVLALYYLRDGISTVAPTNVKFENLSAQDLLLIYHFYNRGHNNFIVSNWWQGNNFATCVEKYLRLYTSVDVFISKIISGDYDSAPKLQNVKNKTEEKKWEDKKGKISDSNTVQVKSTDLLSRQHEKQETKYIENKGVKSESIMKKENLGKAENKNQKYTSDKIKTSLQKISATKLEDKHENKHEKHKSQKDETVSSKRSNKNGDVEHEKKIEDLKKIEIMLKQLKEDIKKIKEKHKSKY